MKTITKQQFKIGQKVKITGQSAWKGEEGKINSFISENGAYRLDIGNLRIAFFPEEFEVIK